MDRLAYTLHDQVLMSRATNYFDWQARVIAPEVGQRVVEVGCGTGNFTGALLDREAVIAIDVEPECVEALKRRYPNRPNLHTAVADPQDAASFAELARYAPDSCVCLNVLEHIEDDLQALRSMAAILPPGGIVALLVPAFPALYGPIDRNLAHHRRYSKDALRNVSAQAGLTVQKLRYMNCAGFFGWWLNARIVGREVQSAAQIALFDRWVVPWLSRLEAITPPPFGLSLIAILRKK